MSSITLAVFVLLDTALYACEIFCHKLFSLSYKKEVSLITPVFSVISGVIGFLLTLALYLRTMTFPSPLTLGLGVAAGVILFLYNTGSMRAAQTGPYAFQSVITLFGCVVLPLIFSVFLWQTRLSGLQMVGIVLVLCSFVALNWKGLKVSGTKKGYYGWVALLFLSNGVYSSVLDAQARLTLGQQQHEMAAIIFLTLTVLSACYLFGKEKGRAPAAFQMEKKSWVFALLSSVTFTAAVNLLMVLLSRINASILYPIQNSGILILLVLLSAVILHEKIEKHTVVGVVIALAGIVALSV